MYMLDTNAVIMAIRHPDCKIVPRIEQHLGKDICISVVTLGELEYGAKKSKYPDKTRTGVYTSRVQGLNVEDWSV